MFMGIKRNIICIEYYNEKVICNRYEIQLVVMMGLAVTSNDLHASRREIAVKASRLL